MASKTASLSILPDFPRPPEPIGLIAGGGRLPVLIAESLGRSGHAVHGVGLADQFDPCLPGLCRTFREVGLFRVGSWCRALQALGIRHAVMVGTVDKARLMHDPWKLVRHLPDWRTARAWYTRLRHDRRSYAVLAAIAEELDRHGVSLMDSTSPIPSHLASAGVMTRTQPTAEQLADVEFVWPMLAELLRLDIGQSVAVRDRDVLAVEAVEGTDRMIGRVAEICRAKGWTLCKGCRAGHDRRSDVPTVGVRTLHKMKDAGGGCLALAAGDVIMLDREDMLAEADRLGIAVVGVPVAGTVITEPKLAVAGRREVGVLRTAIAALGRRGVARV